MTLTLSDGPLACRSQVPTNYTLEGPAHKILFATFPRRVRATFAAAQAAGHLCFSGDDVTTEVDDVTVDSRAPVVSDAMASERGILRDRLVLDTFVRLANTLSSDYEIGEFLQLLVDSCAQALTVDTAGVLLENESGALQLAAAVTDDMEAIEKMELAAGQGPCIEAYRTRKPVLITNLAEEKERWPDVIPPLLDMGMSSGYAFPLRPQDDCIGAMNLFRRESMRFDDDDIRLAQALTDVATIAILQRRKIHAAEARADHLQYALTSRIIIEQAKGILANQHGLTPGQAFDRLRSFARHNQIKVRDLSQQVVDGTAPDL